MTAGQQLQLQRAACRQMLGRGRHFGCHFQTQQRGVGSTRLGRRAQRSHPGVALRTGHGLAQLAGARHRVALALFPGAEQIGDGLAMGLFRQLAQGSLGMVQRITLGTESRVAQTRRTRATLEAVVETTTRTVTAIARAAITAVTPATTIILGLAALRAHAGLRTVIAAHGNGRTMLQGCWCRRTRRPFFGRRSFSRSLRGCCRRFFGMRGHFGSGFALALDGVFQRAHGSVDGLGIALGIGRFQGLGSFHHHLVALAQGGLGMFALLVLALEGFIQRLADLGYDSERLNDMRRLIDAPNSDIFDVLAYVRFTLAPLARSQRVQSAKSTGMEGYEREMRAFLEFVLDKYQYEGIGELASGKVADFLRIRYGGVNDAKRALGSVDDIRKAFIDIQGHLFR